MKKAYRCFLLLLFFACFADISGKAENSAIEDYLKLSTAELDKAFVFAVQEGCLEKMRELIQAGANVNTPISYQWTSGGCDWTVESTALMYAVRHDCLDMIKVLIKAKRKLGKTLAQALDEAIVEGRSDVAKELIAGGADINYINKDEDTPLILAVKHARPISEFSSQAQDRYRSRWHQRQEIIQTLLTAGANVRHVDKYGRTALMEAVKQHDLNAVLGLLQVPEINTGSFFGFGAKPINYADQDGNTALIYAVKYIRRSYINNQEYNVCRNSQRILELLLKTPGIDPYVVNNDDETALTLLEELKKSENGY